MKMAPSTPKAQWLSSNLCHVLNILTLAQSHCKMHIPYRHHDLFATHSKSAMAAPGHPILPNDEPVGFTQGIWLNNAEDAVEMRPFFHAVAGALQPKTDRRLFKMALPSPTLSLAVRAARSISMGWPMRDCTNSSMVSQGMICLELKEMTTLAPAPESWELNQLASHLDNSQRLRQISELQPLGG